MGERYLPVLLYNPATEGVTPRRNDAVKEKDAAVLDESISFIIRSCCCILRIKLSESNG